MMTYVCFMLLVIMNFLLWTMMDVNTIMHIMKDRAR